MSTKLAEPISPLRRCVVGVVLAAAIGAAGLGASAVATHDHTSGSSAVAMKKEQCWYQGWFREGGVWYQGWFKEAC